MLNKLCRLWLLMGLMVVLAVGCSSTASQQAVALRTDADNASAPVRPGSQTEAIASSANASSSPLEQRLRSEVQQWVGTPHRMGGASRKGTDCSGFVQRMYKNIFQQKIPRSTGLQVRAGRPVDKKQLYPGDLVFFRIAYKGPHVGIYLGGEEFAHASTTKGVMVSSLDEDYWRSSYWTARRYRTGSN